MRWTMRRCDGAMGRWGDSPIASPHRIASSSIASPHRPSHRLIVHRIASSSIASPHRLPLRNASWTTGCFCAHAWRTATGTLRLVLLRKFRTKWKVGILIMFQFTCCMVPMDRCSFDGTHLSYLCVCCKKTTNYMNNFNFTVQSITATLNKWAYYTVPVPNYVDVGRGRCRPQCDWLRKWNRAE